MSNWKELLQADARNQVTKHPRYEDVHNIDDKMLYRTAFQDGAQLPNERLNACLVLMDVLCGLEPDGFGSFVADEFTEPEVLEGRKFLADLRAELERK